MSISKRNRAIRFVTKSFLSIILALLMLVSGFPIDKVVEALQDSKIVDQLYLSKHGSGLAKVVDNFAVKEAKANPGTRVRTVEFFAGQVAGTAGGYNENQQQNFAAQSFSMAESSVDIIDAYVELSAQIGAFTPTGTTGGKTYTGGFIYFDACVPSCSPSPAAYASVTNGLGTNSNESQTLRFRASVTSEDVIAAYTGSGASRSFAVGYCFSTGATCSGTTVANIQGVNARLVITYTYDDTSATQTNTVIYPLDSNTETGSKVASQAACTIDSNCPTFSYNAEIPEISSQLSQFFYLQTSINAATADWATQSDIGGNPGGANTSAVYFEEALSGNGGWVNVMHSGVGGYANNSSQSLEMSTNATAAYVMGGENFVTYTYPNNAATKTRTAVFPVGEVQTTGSTTKSSLVGPTVYFPENGSGTGVVDIKKAWFRVHASVGGNTTAVNLSLTHKVGGNSESGATSFSIASDGAGVSDDGYFIYVIPSSEYTELESANKTTGKDVQMSAQWITTARGAVSAELVITYTYTSETYGYLVTQNLFGGQQTAAPGTSYSTSTGAINPGIPEGTGTVTIRGVSVLANAKDGVSTANGAGGANMSTNGCTPSNTSTPVTDSEITRVMLWKSITGIVTNSDAQTYTACYSRAQNAVMSGRIIITYQWDAPPVTITVSGTLYTSANEGAGYNCSTDAGGQVDLRVAVNGGANTNGTCSSTDGTFSVTGVTDPGGVNIPVVLFISSAEGTKATTVTLSSAGASDITGLTVIIDRVVVTHQGATVMSNTYMSTADNADAGIRYSVSAGNLTVEDGMELHILDGKTFTPGGTVTTSPSSSSSSKDGDLHIDGTGTLNMGTNALSVGGDFNNEGTFTKSTGQTTTFTATATGHTIIDGGENFDSVTFNGTGGGWSFSDATFIDADLTVTAGTLSGTNNITVYGGDVTGNGDINLTGASGLYIEGSGNFGGNTEWDFNNLVFGDNSTSASSISTGSGNINVTGYLWVKTNHTLDAKGKTWTLSATSSVAFYLYGTLDDSTNTSTFAYTGDYSATNTLIAASTGYHNIVIDNATETFYFQASTYTLSGDLTVTAGTLINTGGPTVTVNGGDVTGNGDINIAAGTFTVDGTGNFGGNTAWDFNDLTFGDGSGAATTTASGSGAITIAGDLVVSTNQTLSGTASFNVNGGDVTGNGDINMSGSSVFTVDGTGNFGGDTAWDFNSLFFGNGSGTETTTATGSGSITTNTYLLINASHTLDAKGKTWVLAGSQSTPFFMLGTLDDSTNTSTFEFTALYGSGNVTVPSSAAYHNITINNTSESYDLGGAVTLSGDLVVTAGSINTYAAYTMTVNGGDVTGNGSINFYAGGSLIVDGTGNFGGDTAWQFANLTFGDGSGVTTTTATGTGGVTVTTAMTIAASQTLDAKGKTWTLSGTTGTPLTITGALNDSTNTSTFSFTGDNGGGNTTIPASIEYHNITINNGTETYAPGGTITMSGDFTVTAGTFSGAATVTVNGGDVTGNGTINLTSNTFTVDGVGNFGGDTAWSFSRLVFGNGSGTETTTATGTGSVTVGHFLAIETNQTLDAKGKNWILIDTLDGTPLIINGTLNDSANTSTFSFTGDNPGGSTTIPASAGYHNITINSGAETFVTGGAITLSGDLTVTAGVLNGSSNITVNNNVTGAGTITMSGGIFEHAVVSSNKTFGTSSGTNNWTFNDLKFNHASGGSNYSVTLNGGTGQIIVNGTLTIGDSGSRVVTFDNETSNDRIIDTVNFAIGSQGAFSASSSQNWLVSGTYTNAGTLTENSSTLTLDGTATVNLNSSCADYTSCATRDFYNLIINKTDASDANDNVTLTGNLRANGRLTITDGELIQGAYNVWAGDTGATGTAVSVASAGKWTNISTGDLKLGGGFDSAGVVIFNTNNGSQCTDIADDIVITSTVPTNVRTWSGAGTYTIYNVNVTDMSDGAITITAYTSTLSNTDWTVGNCGFTVAGIFYPEAESGNEPGQCDGSTANLSLRVNGGTAVTTFCAVTSGTFTFSGVSATAGQTITIYSTGANKANLVYVSDGTADTGMNLILNALVVGNVNGGATTIANLFCGNGNDVTCYDSDQDNPNMLFDATDAGTDTLVVEDGVELHVRDIFTPTGNITLSPANTPSSQDGDLHVTGTINMATYNLSIGGDYVNTGSYTCTDNSQTTTFTATGSGFDIAPGASSPSFCNLTFNGASGGWSNSAAMTVANVLTMTNGTLSGTNDVTVQRDVIGTAGVINKSGGTFLQTISFARYFGPTTSNTDWVFNNLHFASDSGTQTVQTQSCSNCDVTVNGVLLVSTSGMAGTATILDAGDKTWTINSSAQQPLDSDGKGANSTITPESSTFVFTGTYSGGDVILENDGYNNITLSPGSAENFDFEGSVTVISDLTVDTNATLIGTDNILIDDGDLLGAGIITLTGGTVTMDGPSTNVAGTQAWQFYNLAFGQSIISIGTSQVTILCQLSTYNLGSTHDFKGRNWIFSNTCDVTNPLNLGSDIFNDSTNTSTLTFTGNYTGGNTSIPASTGYNNVTLTPGSAENYTIGSGTVTLSGDLTINTNATLIGTGNITVNGGDVTGAGDVNLSGGGSFAVDTSGNFGGDNSWDFYDLTFGNGSGTSTTTLTGAGSLTIWNNLTFGGATETLSGSKNINAIGGTASGSGPVNLTGGTFMIDYIGNFGTTAGATFYDLQIGDGSGTTTTTAVNGDFTVTHNFVIGTGQTFDMTTNNKALDVAGNFTINTSGVFNAPSSANWKVAGTYANSGTLNESTSTLTLYGTSSVNLDSSCADYTSCATKDFYNLYIDKTSGTDANDNITLTGHLRVNGRLTINDGELIQGAYNVWAGDTGATGTAVSVTANGKWNNISTGDLKLGGGFTNAGIVIFNSNNGTQCTDAADDIVITSTSGGQVRTWSITGGGTYTIYNVAATDMADSSITAYTSSLTNTTWSVGSCGVSVSGVFYQSNESTADPGQCNGSTQNLSLRVNGGAAITTSCAASSGIFSFTSVSFSAGNTVTIYSTGANKANLVYVSDGTADTNMHLYENTLVVGNVNGGATTIANLFCGVGNDATCYDNDQNATDMLFDATDAATDTLIVEDGVELHIRDSFTPTGTVTTSPSSSASSKDGDFHIATAGTYTATNATNVGGDFNNQGTFDNGAQTVFFGATSTGHIITDGGSNFDNAFFNGVGGGWSFADSVIIGGTFTMNSGTLSGNSDIRVIGSINATGGVINLSSPSIFEHRVGADRGFGPSTASTTWTFYTLKFTSSSNTRTVTARSCSGCNVVVNGTLLVSESTMGGTATALNAGDLTWSLAATNNADPFDMDQKSGSLIAGTSTFVYSGANSAGDVNIENATYNNLTLSGSDNFDFEGNTIISRALKVDTNATLIGSDNITVRGSLVGNGTVNKSSGTVKLEGAGKFAGNTGWTFNDLHIGEPLATSLPSTPTSITDCTGLQNMSNDTSGHYILANDIDCSATSTWNSGAGFIPVGPPGVYFSGEFDGQGYTISDLFINRPTTDYQGLFGSLQVASIRNVRIVNANVTGQARSGVLAGNSYVSNITNVYVSGTMTSTADSYLYVGGLVGSHSSEPPTPSVISNCWSDVDVIANAGTDTAQVGGLVGINQYSATYIENSIATGDVLCDFSCGGFVGTNSDDAVISNSSASGNVTGISVGGFAGANYSSSPIIENSYATGTVTATGSTSSAGGLVDYNGGNGIIRNSYATGNVSAGKQAGGLVAYNYNGSIIENSYATGTVYSTAEDTYNYIGGLVGHNRTASITDSYATGSATAAATANNNYVGGLVGENQDTGVVTNSYATGAVSGNANPGGLVGNNISSSTCTNSFWDTQTSGQASSQCGTGYTTANMKTMSNFTGAGWDVVSKTNWVSEDWYMEDGTDYPRIWLTKYESSGTGAVTVNGSLKIGYGEILDAKGRTWNLNGTNGTPFVLDGTLDDTANDSTFIFAGVNGSGDTTIPASSGYHNLTMSPGSAETFVTTGNIALSGALTTNSNTTWNSSGNLNTNGGTVAGAITFGGDLTVPAGTLSGTANITVGGAASGNGIITMSSGDFSVQGTGNFGGNANWTFNNLTLGNPINAPAGGATSITNCTELQGMSGNLSGSYVLANDIDCSATSGWNGGAGFVPIGDNNTPFTGTLDGQNYTISGLYINRPTTDYQGLFGYTGSATIKNVGLLNVNITGQARTGGLAGNANLNAVISNAYVTGNVTGTQDVGLLAGYSIAEITKSFSSGTVTGTGSDVGGLVGYFDNGGAMTDSYSTAVVYGADSVGGLVGAGGTSSIANSYATGDVNISSSRGGGLVGQINGTTVQKSYATGNVTGSANYDYGGLVGYNTGTSSISDSYATGNVSGPQNVGGLVGSIEANASVTRSYATGSVSGAGTKGGLVASSLGTCTNSFWNTESSGQETSDCGTAKTTAEMKTLATFTGASWSIADSTAVGAAVWFIDDGVDYAHLAWEFNSDDPAISASGSGNVTVAGQLFVDSSHTLDLKGKTWTFSGSVGAPLIAQAAFTDTAGTSTVVFSGASSGGNVVIPTNGTYNNLTINGSDTYQPAGNLVLAGDLAATSGTLASTQNVIVQGGSVTGNGDIAQTAGTFTVKDSGTFGGDTAWEFNNLKFANPIDGNEIAVVDAEAGDTSQFTDITGALTADAAAKKEGNYGYKILFNGATSDISGHKQITTQTTDTYLGWWLYIPSGYSFGANTLKAMAELTSSSWGSRSFVWLETNGSGVPNGWRLQTNTNYSSSTTNFSLDAWHYMELAWIKGTGANGGGQLWVDGTLAASVLDGNETAEDITHVIVGLYQGNNPVNGAYIYTDSIVVTNSRISSTGTTASGSGSVTANTLTVGANHELYGGSKTYILTGTGTPLTLNGTFTPASSTISYRGAGAVNIPNVAYYNLDAKPASGSPTYTLPSGTLNVSNNFVVGDGTNAVTVTATTNDGPINVNGALTISANGGVFTASDTGLLTVRGNWTNNGTFNNSGGTVKIQPYTEVPVVIGGTSVNNFHSFQSSPTSSSQNITLQFKNGSTTGFAGTLTLTGQKGQPVYIQSDSFGAQWSMNLTGTGNVTYAVIRDSACTGGDIVQSESNLDYGNNGACWKLVSRSTPNSGTSGGGTGTEGGSQGSGTGGVSCVGVSGLCDDFERAALGSNWTTRTGSPQIYNSSDFGGGTQGENLATWSGSTVSNDQYSEIVIAAQPAGHQVFAVVRYTNASNYYMLTVDSSSFIIEGFEGGSYGVLLNLGSPYPVAGDTIRLEAIGTTLKVYVNGVYRNQVTSVGLTSGVPGLGTYTGAGAPNSRIELWRGGDAAQTGGGSGGGGGTPTP